LAALHVHYSGINYGPHFFSRLNLFSYFIYIYVHLASILASISWLVFILDARQYMCFHPL
jgi:hypothetical protein